MTRECTRCHVARPIGDFPRNRRGRDGLDPRCRSCRAADQREWHIRNPERSAEIRRAADLRKNCATVESYAAQLAAQGGVCAICGQAESHRDNAGRPRRHLAVDHDHETGHNRGLLCSGCNMALGGFGDDAERLRAAIRYLDYWAQAVKESP